MGTHLNDEQLSAVLCKDSRIVCLAGAGTGKTSTMLARISHLVDEGADPSSILALTFTNAAAFEMKDRYQKSHKTGPYPEFRTFHSFCYAVLSSNPTVRSKLGYLQTPEIADDMMRKKILREAGSITNIKSSLESLEKKKNRSVKEQYDYEMLQKTAAKLMRKSNTITFDDLCKKVCKLFKENDPCIEYYKSRYKYVFVDEFQDTDPVQNDFVQSFVDSNIYACGDAQQSIYAFRGARSDIIKSLSSDPSWTTIKLFKNYRSPKTICDFANEHSKYAKDSFRVDLISGRNEEGEPVICKKVQGFIPFGGIHEKSRDFCIEDIQHHSGSTAVLFRTNREVDAMRSYFEDHDIPYRKEKKTEDVKHTLISVGDNEHLIAWLSSYLNADKYASFIRVTTLAEASGTPYDVITFINDFGNVNAVAERWNVIRTIRRICKQPDISIMEKCNQILDILQCTQLKLDPEKCFDMRHAVDHIISAYEGDTEAPGADVYIGTIHSVKGLEFDNVYVLGVGSSTFPLDTEENKNLYYVAITRAKKHLVVFEKELSFDDKFC